MPRLARNGHNPETTGGRPEHEIGSLPLGSYWEWVGCDGQVILRGFLMWVNNSRAIVLPTYEGDGNFDGMVEAGTLRRMYRLNEEMNMPLEQAVVWLGVSEELAKDIEEEHGREARAKTSRATPEPEQASKLSKGAAKFVSLAELDYSDTEDDYDGN